MKVTIRTKDGKTKEIEIEGDSEQCLEYGFEYEGEDYYQCIRWCEQKVYTYFHESHFSLNEDYEVCNDWLIDSSKLDSYDLWMYAYLCCNFQSIDEVIADAERSIDYGDISPQEWNKMVDEYSAIYPKLNRYNGDD